MKTERLILTDVDGVLLDWQSGFNDFMTKNGYKVVQSAVYDISKMYGIDRTIGKALVKEFNNSAACGFLKPLRDSVWWVQRLSKEHGFKFHAITSLSSDEYAGKLRKQLLTNLFGNGVFERLTILDCGADKDEALEEYKNSGLWWIEDKVKNAELGANMGLRSIVMLHDYNYKPANCYAASTWAQIGKIILEDVNN